MEQHTVNNNDYLKQMSYTTLFLEKEILESYKNDNQINIRKDISINLLKDLISNDKYYEYVKKLFNDEIKEFVCCYIIYGDTASPIKLSKYEIVMGIKKCLHDNKFKLEDKALTRYKELFYKVNFAQLINLYKDKNIFELIDNQNISIPFNSIFAFLQLPEKEFYDFFIKNNDEILNGIKKEHFIYSVLNFFKNEKIKNNYIIPEHILYKIEELNEKDLIDIESLNKLTKTNELFLDKVEINKELKFEIFKTMPNNLTLIEKAIYIYIKMCKLLKYDSEFYAVNQKGEATKKHKDINRIKTINLSNNEIVCYEFNIIYAKLLNELGINLEIHSALIDDFGGGHANLSFRVDKYLVGADSVTFILNGDLIKAKLNYPLDGLYCINKNINTKNEFNQILSKVYALITKKEKKEKLEDKESFDDILIQYKNVTSNEIYLDVNEKIELLMTKLSDSKLTGMDAFSYLLILRKIIFNELERKYNIIITIIKNNELSTNDKVAEPSAIIAINQVDINDYDSNTYFIYNPQKPLNFISLNDINKKFRNGYYEYIDEKKDKEKIPGVNYTKGSK